MKIKSASSGIAKEEKFKIVYDEFYRYAYKIAYNILKNSELMDDVLQDIFIHIWRAIDSINLSDRNGTKAFIGIIAKNTTINAYNKQKRITPNMADIEDDVLLAFAKGNAENPLDVASFKDGVDYIYSQIDTLSETYRTVMSLMYKQNCSPEEISGMLGMNIKTVYTKITRGRQLLKAKQLEGERRMNV